MKLLDLNPEWRVSNTAGQWTMTFDCPTTKGGRVYVTFHRDAPRPGVWQVTGGFGVHPQLQHLGEQPDMATLTLVPSIGDHNCTKRNRRCPGHLSIFDGEVHVLAPSDG